jgi:hypothetical protein
MRRNTAASLALVAGLLMAGTAGCLGYRVGSSLPPGIRSVHIPAFVNRTAEPQLDGETTRAAIQEFQKDGTLRVAEAADADATLIVELVSYGLEPLRYEPDRARTTSEYRLRIGARLTFQRRGVVKPMIERVVAGETTFQPAGDLAFAKAAALPAAARDLAHQIVKNVVEFWE